MRRARQVWAPESGPQRKIFPAGTSSTAAKKIKPSLLSTFGEGGSRGVGVLQEVFQIPAQIFLILRREHEVNRAIRRLSGHVVAFEGDFYAVLVGSNGMLSES